MSTINPTNLIPILERISICGCGDPDVPLQVIREVLEHMPLYEPQNQAWLGSREEDPWKVFALHALDGWQLIEHGSSIGGSWLTEDGAALLTFLRLTECKYHRWATLTTAALNCDQEPLPTTLSNAWLDERAREYAIPIDDEDEA